MFACKCLNILIHTENNDIQKVELESLQLSDTERSDLFFRQEIRRVVLGNISKEQAGLVSTRNVGPWIIHTCLNCSLDTHAIHTDRGANFVIIATDLLSGSSNVASSRSLENYSPVFRILINVEVNDGTEVSKMAVSQLPANLQLAMTGLQQQLAEVVRREVNVTEEKIRRYTEMQYSALEAFREQAHREHQSLVKLLMNAQPKVEMHSVNRPFSNSSSSVSTTVAAADPSAMEESQLLLPSPRQAIPKPKHPTVTNLTKSKKSVNRQISHPVHRLESLDTEGLFPLDGMDESPALMQSDVEESDTDDSASHDEGIHIPRQRAQSMSMAKSLPMNIPVFMSAYTHDIAEEKIPPKAKEDSVDIAASIKALAKSVHGDAVFGDLPRPRFSTQI